PARGDFVRFGRFRVARSGEVLRWGMDVLKIESSIQICEITHDTEQSLMRVRFQKNGRPQQGYLEFFELRRPVYDKSCGIEDDPRRAGHLFGKAEKPQ